MDRREFLKALGLITIPLIVKPKLIFDMGAHSYKNNPIENFEFDWKQVAVTIPITGICPLMKVLEEQGAIKRFYGGYTLNA